MATAAAAAAQDEEPADAAEQSEAMATAAAAENAVEPLEATEATSTAEDHDEEMSMTSWIRQGRWRLIGQSHRGEDLIKTMLRHVLTKFHSASSQRWI
mmetsp:Transcript_14322/g.53988  ORF Transcript_14322/g.53988 Transcript_14322/m.53988 type:complete len:98 (-) Transcript_14322:860-1153(-)